MPAKYDRDGFAFQYPDNWVLEEDPSDGLPRTVSVTAESGAFWSLSIYDDGTPPAILQQQTIEALSQEYEGVETDELEIELMTQQVDATDLQFYCLDFLIHARLIPIARGNYSALLIWQAEDREFDQLETVFQAITISMISETRESVA